MKKISEHLGEIIVALAAIALLVTAVVVFRAPLGGFFGNVVDKTTSIGQAILANMDDWELGAFGGSGGSGGSGATDSDGPNLVFDQELGSTSHNPLAVESGSFTLSGTVSDKSGIASLTVNGNNVTVADNGTWSTTLTLTQNEVTEVCVVATNAKGNTTEKTGYVGYIQYIEVSVGKDAYAEEIGYSDDVTELVIPATFEKDGQLYKVTNIDNFKGCTNLSSVTIPESVTNLASSAFQECTGLTSVVIPGSVKKIGVNAFLGCTQLTGELVIPSSVTSIGKGAFQNCSSLTRLAILGNVTSIEVQTFYRCTNLTSVVIPDSVTIIDESAFSSCVNLTNLVIPDNVTSIGTSAFYGCKKFNFVEIPDSVTSIGYVAFKDCTNLMSVVIPDSVKNIGKEAFYGCTSLVSISFVGALDEWNALTKGNYWNRNVPATQVVCSDGTVTL